jgi:hypothetical protein
MPDKWFAECLPCRWEDKHDSQMGAIDAAVNHVMEKHRNVLPEQRAGKKIGHVQLRTEETPPAEPQPPAGSESEPSAPVPVEAPAEPEPAESLPETEPEAKHTRHWRKRGED